MDALKEKNSKEPAPLFNIVAENEKNGTKSSMAPELTLNVGFLENFFLKIDDNPNYEYNKNNSLFLIVRSLKNDDGTQRVTKALSLLV